ncbi:MAG: hypothetical protein LBG60_17305, partial [Bifidobacteriaceae bacterium]|nr:hypothetical protein [Bifidobacteriaceae bacterium]
MKRFAAAMVAAVVAVPLVAAPALADAPTVDLNLVGADRWFTSIAGGDFNVDTDQAGTVYLQVGGAAPADGEALAALADSGGLAYTGAVSVGSNTVNAGAVDNWGANDSVRVYAAVENGGGEFSPVVATDIGAYSGDQGWFALPGAHATDAVTQTVRDQTNYRLAGLSGQLAWLNDRDLSIGDVPVELGASFSASDVLPRSYTVDGDSVAGATVPLRLNGLTATGTGVASPVGLVDAAAVAITLVGASTLTGRTNHAGLSVPGGTAATITAASGTPGSLT